MYDFLYFFVSLCVFIVIYVIILFPLYFFVKILGKRLIDYYFDRLRDFKNAFKD